MMRIEENTSLSVKMNVIEVKLVQEHVACSFRKKIQMCERTCNYFFNFMYVHTAKAFFHVGVRIIIVAKNYLFIS